MSHLADLINELCPDGVEYKPLDEVGEFVRGSGLQKSDFVDEGLPCVHYGQIHTRFGIAADEAVANISAMQFHRLKHANHGDLLIATTSEDDEAVGKATVWLGHEEVAIGGDMFIFRHVLEPKYVSYFFASSLFGDQKRPYITGTKVKRISEKGLSRIRIPVPPLEVQCEIVRILDRFTTLEAELEAELEARRAQYEYYRNQLLSYDALVSRCPNGVQYKSIGSFSKCVAGATPNSKNPSLWDGDIPWMSSGEVNKKTVYSTNRFITQLGFDSCSTKMVPAGAVVIALAGQGKTRGTVARIRIELCTNQSLCAIITDKTVDSDYLFHYLSGQYDNLRAVSSGDGTRGGLNLKMIRAYKVPVPPIEEQRRIADVLDRFDMLVNDISSGLPAEIAARRAQYEYYRDRLLSFTEKK